MTDAAGARASTRRPGGRTARVRARILEATTELVARDGIAGLRYEEVAARAGVAKTSVYRNWPDREELVVEAMLRYAEDTASVPDTGDLRDDLVTYLMRIADGLATPTGRALAQATQSAHQAPSVRRTVTRLLEQRTAALRRRVDAAAGKGELPPVDAQFLGEMLSGPVHLFIDRAPRPFTRPDAERIVDVVLAGIRNVPGSR